MARRRSQPLWKHVERAIREPIEELLAKFKPAPALPTLSDNDQGGKLNLSKCMIDDVSCIALFHDRLRGLTKLRWLDIGSNPISDHGLEALARHPGLSELMALSLRQCEYISECGLKHFANAKIPLQMLDISLCGNVTDDGLKYLADAKTPLQTLTLSQCKRITDAGLKELAGAKTPLHKLELFSSENITDVGLKHLAEAKTPLQTLNLSECGNITDVGLKHLAEAKTPLHMLTLPKWGNITDTGLEYLAAAKTPLQTLVFESDLTDVGLKHLAEAKTPLRTLCLSGCWQVTDVGLKHLADARTPLESLILSECGNITDVGLKNLADAKTPLQTLDLSLCTQVTDDGVKHLSAARTPLRSLDLSMCARVTDVGLKHIESLLPANGGSLRFLNIEGCTGLGLTNEILRKHDAAELFRLIAAAADVLLEAKLVLLGDGRIGKTQLFKQLFGLPLDGDEPSTPDFVIGRREIAVTFGDPGTEHQLNINCFDFAGQQSLHASHRFFLSSRRTAYIIVVDATKTAAENHLQYWLGFVQHYCVVRDEGQTGRERESSQVLQPPVLVVVSHCDELRNKKRALQIDAAWLKERYTGPIRLLDNFHSHPASSDVIREEMKTALEDALRPPLGHLDEAFDKRSTRGIRILRQWVTGDTTVIPDFAFENHCGISYFEQACRSAGQKDPAEFRISLQTLRNLGAVHWVGDSSDVRPGEEVAQQVFSPDWVRTPVGFVARFSDLGGTHGKIQHNALVEKMRLDGQLLKNWRLRTGRDFDRDAGFVIRLMEVCDLVFEECAAKPSDNPTLLVLDQMPSSDEDLGEGGRGEVVCTGQALGFVPESTLARLAGFWFEHIPASTSNLYRNQITIRNGTISASCWATVTCDHLAGRFEVRMRGGTEVDHQRLLALIHDRVAALIKVNWEMVGKETVSESRAEESSDYPEPEGTRPLRDAIMALADLLTAKDLHPSVWAFGSDLKKPDNEELYAKVAAQFHRWMNPTEKSYRLKGWRPKGNWRVVPRALQWVWAMSEAKNARNYKESWPLFKINYDRGHGWTCSCCGRRETGARPGDHCPNQRAGGCNGVLFPDPSNQRSA